MRLRFIKYENMEIRTFNEIHLNPLKEKGKLQVENVIDKDNKTEQLLTQTKQIEIDIKWLNRYGKLALFALKYISNYLKFLNDKNIIL